MTLVPGPVYTEGLAKAVIANENIVAVYNPMASRGVGGFVIRKKNRGSKAKGTALATKYNAHGKGDAGFGIGEAKTTGKNTHAGGGTLGVCEFHWSDGPVQPMSIRAARLAAKGKRGGDIGRMAANYQALMGVA